MANEFAGEVGCTTAANSPSSGRGGVSPFQLLRQQPMLSPSDKLKQAAMAVSPRNSVEHNTVAYYNLPQKKASAVRSGRRVVMRKFRSMESPTIARPEVGKTRNPLVDYLFGNHDHTRSVWSDFVNACKDHQTNQFQASSTKKPSNSTRSTAEETRQRTDQALHRSESTPHSHFTISLEPSHPDSKNQPPDRDGQSALTDSPPPPQQSAIENSQVKISQVGKSQVGNSQVGNSQPKVSSPSGPQRAEVSLPPSAEPQPLLIGLQCSAQQSLVQNDNDNYVRAFNRFQANHVLPGVSHHMRSKSGEASSRHSAAPQMLLPLNRLPSPQLRSPSAKSPPLSYIAVEQNHQLKLITLQPNSLLVNPNAAAVTMDHPATVRLSRDNCNLPNQRQMPLTSAAMVESQQTLTDNLTVPRFSTAQPLSVVRPLARAFLPSAASVTAAGGQAQTRIRSDLPIRLVQSPSAAPVQSPSAAPVQSQGAAPPSAAPVQSPSGAPVQSLTAASLIIKQNVTNDNGARNLTVMVSQNSDQLERRPLSNFSVLPRAVVTGRHWSPERSRGGVSSNEVSATPLIHLAQIKHQTAAPAIPLPEGAPDPHKYAPPPLRLPDSVIPCQSTCLPVSRVNCAPLALPQCSFPISLSPQQHQVSYGQTATYDHPPQSQEVQNRHQPQVYARHDQTMERAPDLPLQLQSRPQLQSRESHETELSPQQRSPQLVCPRQHQAAPLEGIVPQLSPQPSDSRCWSPQANHYQPPQPQPQPQYGQPLMQNSGPWRVVDSMVVGGGLNVNELNVNGRKLVKVGKEIRTIEGGRLVSVRQIIPYEGPNVPQYVGPAMGSVEAEQEVMGEVREGSPSLSAYRIPSPSGVLVPCPDAILEKGCQCSCCSSDDFDQGGLTSPLLAYSGLVGMNIPPPLEYVGRRHSGNRRCGAC